MTAARWLFAFIVAAAFCYLVAAVAEIGQFAGWWP